MAKGLSLCSDPAVSGAECAAACARGTLYPAAMPSSRPAAASGSAQNVQERLLPRLDPLSAARRQTRTAVTKRAASNFALVEWQCFLNARSSFLNPEYWSPRGIWGRGRAAALGGELSGDRPQPPGDAAHGALRPASENTSLKWKRKETEWEENDPLSTNTLLTSTSQSYSKYDPEGAESFTAALNLWGNWTK